MKPRPSNPHRKPALFLFFVLALLIIFSILKSGVAADGSSAGIPTPSNSLKSFHGCQLVPLEGADGDSFRVRFPNGTDHIVRLYAVDCIEAKIWDESDSRRLKEQRQYFGISSYGGNSKASIEAAKSYGNLASKEVQKLLSDGFTVHTTFADGRGSGYHKRIYGFVTTSKGVDLGTHLVSQGLARAFGVCRQNQNGIDRDELRSRLEDLELRAAKLGLGVWSITNWQELTSERAAYRKEEAELDLAIDRIIPAAIVDPNSAPRDQIMTLPGIGETLALRIIENRPYKDGADLLKLRGLGEGTLHRIESRLPTQFRLSKAPENVTPKT